MKTALRFGFRLVSNHRRARGRSIFGRPARPEVLRVFWLLVLLLQTAAYGAVSVQNHEFSVPGLVAPGQWQYYQVNIAPGSPAISTGWRLVLSTTGENEADLYLKRGELPTELATDHVSSGRTIDTLAFAEGDLSEGTWFIGVRAQPTQSAEAQFRLSAEVAGLTVMEWDPGTADGGTKIFVNGSSSGGDYYFRVRIPREPAFGAWRTVLKVSQGEADLALSPGPWSAFSPQFASTRPGADGAVIDSSRVQEGEEWIIRVYAQPDSAWSLFTGDVYVRGLPAVASDGSSGSGLATIGPEGIRYFSTTVPVDTRAWRLFLNGRSEQIMLRKGVVPVPSTEVQYYDLAAPGQMLVVPDYLNTESYQGPFFIGVAGVPGTSFELDSRKQPIADAQYEAAFNAATPDGFGFVTYRIQVPAEQIAWEVSLTPVTGSPKLALRREKVPNAGNNDAFSEAGGPATASLALTPPVLSDGIFYVTVYGAAPFSFRLQNGPPRITPISYLGETVNDDPDRSGWRYYVVNNIPEQLGHLGWQLKMSDPPAGTQMAIRRNAVPGQWIYRSGDSGELTSAGHYDLSGTDLIQQPGHPADVWYVGVFNPHRALGTFRLARTLLNATPIQYASGLATRMDLPHPTLDYYSVAIPPGTPRWRINLTCLQGDAFLIVRKDALPPLPNLAGNSIRSESGKIVSKAGDESCFILPVDGEQEITPGTYYLAVGTESSAGARSSYRLASLASIPITQAGRLEAAGITLENTILMGELQASQFEVGSGEKALTIALSTSGNPLAMALRLGTNIARSSDMTYGIDGGYAGTWNDRSLITIPNPAPGIYTLAIQALTGDSSYTIRVRQGAYDLLEFDGGQSEVFNQMPRTWRFFQMGRVPSHAQGWDLRLAQVTSGFPRLLVRRGLLPDLGSSVPTVYRSSTAWPVGYEWIAEGGWDERSYGRRIVVGMGNPLEPNTAADDLYFVGIYNSGDEPASYRIESRGIGEALSIPVQDLNYREGTANILNLPKGEAAYFRINIVGSGEVWRTSWRADLSTISGEAMLLVQKGVIPGIEASDDQAITFITGGAKLQRAGGEYLSVLPPTGAQFLENGEYFLAVVSEGGGDDDSCTAVLTSAGPVPIRELGPVPPAGLTLNDTVGGGNFNVYTFLLPDGVQSVEARLENRVANPILSLRKGSEIPRAANSTTWLGGYGGDGGASDGRTDPEAITLPNPGAGIFTLIVKGGPPYEDASYLLRLRVRSAAELSFDGSFHVSDHEPGSWRYFRVEIPAGARGWDLRTRDVASASDWRPFLVICRNLLPDFPNINSVSGRSENWPPGFQWQAGIDWTGHGSTSEGLPELGQMIATGLGPLEPGTYFVGVANFSDQLFDYTVASRGIGPGFSLPVQDLTFAGGTATNLALVPREAAYYKVTVPPNTRRWRMKLSVLAGDALMVVRKGEGPNSEADASSSIYNTTGRKMQKPGGEQFYLLAEPGHESLEGDYYIAVVSEGINPGENRIGTDTSAYILESLGEPALGEWSEVTPEFHRISASLSGGEYKVWEFMVPEGVQSLQFQLTRFQGTCAFAVVSGDGYPNPSTGHFGYYGVEGGMGGATGGLDFLSLPNPAAGLYRLAAKGIAEGGGYPGAEFELTIRSQGVTLLSFDPALNAAGATNRATGFLEDQQSTYFRVMVPENLNGARVLGWRLRADQMAGLVQIRLRKGALPSNEYNDQFQPGTCIIVPPLLEAGEWFLELRAWGSTEYSLESEALTLEAISPAMPENSAALERPEPFFDTGRSGVDLPSGEWHFYATDVPTNRMLLRVQAEAISGKPRIFVRPGNPPTANNIQSGAHEYSLYGDGTAYANIVPNSRTTSSICLEPGRWYFGIFAAEGSNVRYRLVLSSGWIQPLSLRGGTLHNQILAASDWLYYAVDMPLEAPVEWRPSFAQISGDVTLYLRDTVPPGMGSANYLRTWGSDYQAHDWALSFPYFEEPGTPLLRVPPVRPGQTYYLGIEARSDAVFSIGSDATDETIQVQAILPFYGGRTTNNLAAGAQAIYRVDIPEEGVRWLSQAYHSAAVRLYLKQGTLPAPPVADWTSFEENSRLNARLVPGSWPWVPGQSWYLLAVNEANSVQPFGLDIDGRNAATDDENGNGLPDLWERQYFGQSGVDPEQDADGDGWTNLEEFLRVTNPTVRDPSPVFVLSPPVLLPGGEILMEVRGPEKLLMFLQYSDDLKNWYIIQRVSNLPGTFKFRDYSSSGTLARFYRLKSP